MSLRWRMVRSRRVRIALTVVAILCLVLLVLGIAAGATIPLGPVADGSGSADLVASAPTDRTGEVAVLLPSAMIAFALFSIVAPLGAGGGTELIPEAELVAYPVRVPTLVRIAFLLSPLNIAWFFQVLLLVMATAYAVRGPGGPGLPLGVLVVFLAACTTIGHTVSWALVGVRRTRRGRRTTWSLLALAACVVGWVIATDRGTAVLDSLPTVRVVAAQARAARLDLIGFAPITLGLLLAAVVGYATTVWTAQWALRRPGDLGIDGPLTRPIGRRTPPRDEARALLQVDRASVWRSAPLRRGLLVLAILPVGAAALASLPWSSIALLPPLVSSGAALLFGVNALSLDGSGAIWVSTMPHDPALVLRSKARVVTEVVGGAVLLVLLGASARASAAPTAQDLLCAVGASLSCTALVVATCLRLSVTRPHRAELRGPRDTPAPPGTMALYSARLAGITTLVGLVFSISTFGDSWEVPLAFTIGLLAWAARSWSHTRRLWSQPATRAVVVATVATG